ncbi:alpha/beta hydrolase [Streptomyces sp. G1]|uniref:alpha/beta hydrolase n=1 Tax=Streptomyces sp. G1 TaxID=361572 RepID=UPI0020309407|nr:alpha/beta fold hydrolase [Streptomyces sp. G1]MCM1965883.1 alpha/beta fold hydrolase [Streptomyces sp. G1]
MTLVNVAFDSDGVRLAGDLFLPDAAENPVPGVVMAPGFGGVKEMLMRPYAASLNEAGIAVLIFDYAGFGHSDGEPRQHLNLDAQQNAYRHALDYLAACPGIDADRLGVFGTSMSGGHALAVAASDSRVRSTVVLIPFTGLDTSTLGPEFLAMFEDAARRQAAGEAPQMIASTGKPGTIAAMTSDGAWEWMERMTADAPTYRNEVTLASLWNLANYHPAFNLKAITSPVHAILATDDAITPAPAARSALSAVPQLDVVEIPQTHFELFTDHLQETIDLTTRWFEHDLGL